MRNNFYKKTGILLILGFLFCSFSVIAQESVTVSGKDISGSNGSVSYSVGQLTYQTHTGTNGSVAEGVQQPYEISVVTAIDEAKGINLSVSAYPNPTSDYLTLKIDASATLSIQSMSYQLFDMQGKLLQKSKITSNQTNIVMKNLVPATYFLKVIEKTQGIASQELKTFKIIKTQ